MNDTSILIQLVSSPPTWATVIAAAFLLITLALSMYLLFEHLSAYKNPEEQKFLIGVILMVPCYSIESVSPHSPPTLLYSPSYHILHVMSLLTFRFPPTPTSLYHWSIHQSGSIARFSGTAMNPSPCIALEDTLLPVLVARKGPFSLWKDSLVSLLKLLFCNILLTRPLSTIPFLSTTSLNPGNSVIASTKLLNLALFNMYALLLFCLSSFSFSFLLILSPNLSDANQSFHCYSRCNP